MHPIGQTKSSNMFAEAEFPMAYLKWTTAVYMFVVILVDMWVHTASGLLIVKPQDTYVLTGQVATLNCSTSSTEDVHWYHGTSYVYAGRKLYSPYKDRLKIEVYQIDDITAYNLVFPSAKPEDAGMYNCLDEQGRGETSSAEVTVFTADGNGTCQSNMKPDGVVIPNDCNIDPDEVLLFCSITYYGNNPPQLEWKKVPENGASAPNTECQSINSRIVCNTSIIGDRQMNRSSYVCQTIGSSQPNIKLCTIEVKNLIYAFSGETTTKSSVGNEVQCKSDTSQTCRYKWKHSGIVVSTSRTITPDRTGLYQCEAMCNIRGKRCIVFDYAYISDDDSTSCSTGCVVGICVGILLLVITILTVIYCLLLKKEKDRSRPQKNGTQEELTALNQPQEKPKTKEDNLKTKKRSKQSLLAEHSKEIELLDKKIEIERTEKESLQLANEQFRINIDKEIQVNKTLTEKVSNEAANYDAHIKRLNQEMDKNRIANNELQTKNDKLKQELDAEKTNNVSLQTSNDKYKATVKILEKNAETLSKEINRPTTKTDEQKVIRTLIPKAASKEKKAVFGLTILGKELFVLSYEWSEIEVFGDLQKLASIREFQLKGHQLELPWDMQSSSKHNCLYIADKKVNDEQYTEIFKIDPKGIVLTKWQADCTAGRLSVTNESNVIVTSLYEHKIREYSSDGDMIRLIEWPKESDAAIVSPWVTLKRSEDEFIISHGNWADSRNGVFVSDLKGNIKYYFGGRKGSNYDQLHVPVHMVAYSDGRILVVDKDNSRVVLLSPELKFLKVLFSQDGSYRFPNRICLDEQNKRMFVSDNQWKSNMKPWNDGRVLVFDMSSVQTS